MRKLIHSNFEIDLSNFKVSDTEENNWFSDSFFTKFTFPFEIDLTNDLDIALDFISYYTTNPQTYFEVMYQHYDILVKADFEIESLQNRLSCTFSFGFDQLPNFDKKLADLPLEKFNLPAGTSIYDHANTIVGQTWPAVNYNFPQIHNKSMDVTDDKWAYFKKILNNRVDGVFLQNGIDPANGAAANRNVMQALPYWLYVLQVGFSELNLTLSGDIVSDEYLKRATLYAFIDYNKIVAKQEYFIEKLRFLPDELITTNNELIGIYRNKTYLTGVGKYRVFGIFIIKSAVNSDTGGFIKFNGIYIFNCARSVNAPLPPTANWIFYFDIVVEIDEDTTNELEFFAIAPRSFQDDGIVRNEIITININPIADTEFIFKQRNKIDLTKCVSDVTFGDLIKVTKNWFNYDLTIVGTNAVMNKVENAIASNDAISLEFTEKEKPIRKFQQGKSFLLKFQDVDYPDFKYLPVFQSNTEVLTTGFKTNEKTATIEVAALPLPILIKSGVSTAFAFEDNESKIYLVPYDGLSNGANISLPITDYLMPAVHLRYYNKWFLFRIFSQAFTWGFQTWVENIIDLKVKMKIFAYSSFHVIKNITKTEIKPDLFDVEIETESLK